MAMSKKRYLGKTVEEKFQLRVVKREGCWGWNGAITTQGYGQICEEGNPQALYAHRVSYKIHYGVDPDKSEVMHTCDNPICTNPQHLILGSHLENMADMARKGRQKRGENHYCAKLTQEKVKRIFLLASEGICHARIAQIFGVTCATVCDILKGHTWKWVNHS